jgi:ABC-type sulfate transport system permease subunit
VGPERGEVEVVVVVVVLAVPVAAVSCAALDEGIDKPLTNIQSIEAAAIDLTTVFFSFADFINLRINPYSMKDSPR